MIGSENSKKIPLAQLLSNCSYDFIRREFENMFSLDWEGSLPSGFPQYCKWCGKAFYCHKIPEEMKKYNDHIEHCDSLNDPKF